MRRFNGVSLASRIALFLVALASLPCPAEAATGTGPGGYTWKDCLEVDGPGCAYTLTATTDGSTGLCSDEVYNDSGDGLGFTFNFYGVNRNDYAISSNGLVYLANAPASGSDVVNATLTGFEGRPVIAVMWDDWAMDNWDELFGFCPRDPECSNSGWENFYIESFQRGTGSEAGVPYKEFGWNSTAHHDPCTEDFGQQATFGLRLYQDGRILFLYQDTDLGQPALLDHGLSATIGISSGFNGEYTLVSFNTASIPTNPYAILFEPPGCPALTCGAITIGPDPGCQGQPQTFQASAVDGDPPLVVDWDFNGDTVRDATGNPVVRTLGPGAYNVVATVRDSCTPTPQSCQMFSSTTVLPQPSPTATPQSSTTFCALLGESLTITATPGFVSYQWRRGGVDIVGETSETIVATVSGSYTVVVTDADGCTGESRAVVVNADDCPPPCPVLDCLSFTIQPNPTCAGELQSLRATWSGGEGTVSVSWDLDGDTVQDATGQQIIRTFAAGTHPVTVTLTDQCTLPPGAQTCSMTDDVEVNALPAPVITPGGPIAFCAATGGSLTLNATGGFATYQWYRGGNPLAGETNASLVTSVTGSHVVAVTDAAGCVGLSSPIAVNADSCGQPCPTLTCGAVTVTPEPSCEGDTQDLSIVVTGGQGTVTVGWDLDGDTVGDVTGNPAQVTLPITATSVTARVTDQCADPTPQQCSTTQAVTVDAGAGVLTEISGPGAQQLMLPPGASVITVELSPDATAYNVLSDLIGLYAPNNLTGSVCHIGTWTDNGDGTITLASPVLTNHWVVVTESNHCGEGTAGYNSRGFTREVYAGWVQCGPAP